ncbi:MAG: deoxyribose-phosphate aldolase [Gaiellaceae bacterium]
MARRLQELAKTIDHTLLDSNASKAKIARLCDEAREHHFASVCVLPGAVAFAAECLRGCDVKVTGVVGYPEGDAESRAKLQDAERCAAEGSHELEFVLNSSAMLAGDFHLARDELAAVVHAVGVRSVNSGRGHTLVKVAFDCERLGSKRTQLACSIVEGVGADFVSTSVVAGSEASTLSAVELLREHLSERIGVKASSSVATAGEVDELIAAGAGRIGTPYAVDVMAVPA